MSSENARARPQGVAIIGMACRFPDADDVGAFWESLRAARASFRDIPRERWDHALFHSEVPREHDKTYVRRGAFLDDAAGFAALHFGIAPRRVAVMDPQHRLTLEAVRVALQDAGWEKGGFDRSRMGTFIGISSSEYRGLLSARTLAVQLAGGAMGEVSSGTQQAILDSASAVEPISAFSIPGTLLNMCAANVAHLWNLGGPAFSIDAACASAMVAIYDAVTYLRAGICDTALAGGVYLNLGPENLIGFARASAVSRSGECRPFDAASDGFLQGEGVGMLVLKRLDAALKDGDRIWAVIRGVGINNDGNTSDGPMAPSLSGQADCLRRAYADADVAPASVGLVECHGTATKVGDPVEVNALREVFTEKGSTPGKVWLGSVKGNIGHTMSAAGVAGLMRAALALHHQTVPPQAGFTAPNPLLNLGDGPFEVPREPQPWPRREGAPRRAGVSSFGFGGTNCHVVLEEAPLPTRRPAAIDVRAQEPSSELVILSAESRELLARHAREIAAALEKQPDLSLADVAFTLSATRKHEGSKLALVVATRDELAAALKDAAQRLDGAEPLPLKLSPSAFVTPSGSEKPPKVAFLYPGQGAQRVGLLRWMFERFEGFRSRLKALEHSLEGTLPQPLLSYLYPPTGNGELKGAEERLQATEVCQPVMAALGLALTGFLEELGITPVACAGHSLGEFVAAGAGGILSAEQALRFAALRGRLMADLKLPDPGAMAAVRADLPTVERHLQAGAGIANCNHPQQTVISGTTPAVEATMAALKDAGIGSRRLRVSHAFHSELMSGVARDIARLVQAMPIEAAKVPVVSAITGQAYPTSPDETRETFVRHATSRVDFVSALERCAALGADYFLEVGAGDTLTSFVRSGLDAGRYLGASSLASAEDDRGRELYRSLGMLAALGQPVALELLYSKGERQVVTLPATPLATERYWFTRTTGTAPVTMPQELARGSTAARAATEANVSDDLIKLFREQTALLAQHAEIIARQTAALGGQPMKPLESAALASASTMAMPSAPAPGESAKPASAPAPTAAVATKPAGQVIDVVFDAVAKVSAFPRASLKPTQTLVTDLGLDSLMLMELVSALKAAFPAVGDFPQSLLNQKTTINDLVAFLERSGATAGEAAPAPAAAQIAQPQQPRDAQRFRTVLAPRARSTFPADPLPETAWTLVTTDGGPVGEAIVARLAKAGRRVAAVRLGKPFQGAKKDGQLLRLDWPRELEAVDGLLAELARQSAKPSAILHLADVSLAKPVAELVKSGGARWPNPVPLAQRLAALLQTQGQGEPAGFAIATATGGGFGIKGDAGAAIWQVALSGFAKALSREWEAQIKCVDLDPAQSPEAQAQQFVEELNSADRDVEVGYPKGQRHVVTLAEVPFDAQEKLPFDERSVVLVTGGARGLGAGVALDLAKRTRCGLIIVGSRELAPNDETGKFLATLKQAGARAEYVRWDVRRDDLPAGLEKARSALGPITAIIHCAGLIRDKRVAEKKADDVRQVMDVKVAGLLNVLRATANDPLQLVVGFSSWSGRFGNAGQTDYSAANELMGRLLVSLPGSLRPGVRGVALLWPPWESSGMAKSIPAPLREMMRAEGIPFLSDEVGFAALRRQLSGREDGELVVGLGHPGERHSVRTGMTLSLESHPFLADHAIKGVPVLPMASALDMLGALAHESVRGAMEIRDLQLFNGVEVKAPVSLVAELRSKGRAPGQLELRAGGRVAYRAQVVDAEAVSPLAVPQEPAQSGDKLPMTLEAFYRDVAFHGPRLRGIERVERIGAKHIVGWVRPSRPADWLAKPERGEWAIDPLVIDSSFQLVLYWLWAHHKKAALPVAFKRFVQKAPFGGGRIKCTLVLGEVASDTLTGSIQYEDEQGRLLAVMIDARAKVLDLGVSADAGKGNGAVKSNGATTAAAIDERYWCVEKFPEVKELYERINAAAELGLRNPYFNVNDGVARDTSIVNGREMINYSGYNYLGLSGMPKVSAGAKAAVDRYGTSVSASRVASGEKPLHGELERAIAGFLGTESSVVFSAGHATNEAVIGFMFGDGDLIVHDSLAHNSIQQGAQLSPAKRRPFPHSDWKALDQLLTQLRPHYKKVLIAIEGVYSMDGDFPDLPRFIELRNKHKCLLFVDEAHSIGVMGKTGRGIGEHFGVKRTDVDFWMGTLSKSFASCGGYIAGTKPLVDYIKYSTPGFVFSAGISPANAGAAKAAIEEIAAHPELVTRLRERAQLFLSLAKKSGIDTGMSQGSAVIPCIVGNSLLAMHLSQQLANRGINVQPIGYPAVEESAARLRFFVNSSHTEDQIRRTIEAIAEELKALRGDEGEQSEAR